MPECLFPDCTNEARKKWCPEHRQSGPRWEDDQKPLAELAPGVDVALLERVAAMPVPKPGAKPWKATHSGVKPQKPPDIGYATVRAALDRSQGRGLTSKERVEADREMPPRVRIVTAGDYMGRIRCSACRLPLGEGNEVALVYAVRGLKTQRYHSPACVPPLR